MQMIYLDGPAKVGKSCVGEAMYDALTADGQNVEIGVAGDFFRRITDETLRRAGVEVTGDGEQLAGIVEDIIDEGLPYREDHHWGDLQAPEITDNVHHIGRLRVAQAASEDWFARRARAALEADADTLIVDGRNPRRRLAEWCEVLDVPVALDLFLSCEVGVAAKRALIGEGYANPTAEQIAAKAERLAERRAADAQPGRLNAFVEPRGVVGFVPARHDPETTVKRSFFYIGGNAPRPIYLDNTSIEKYTLLTGTTALARAATQFLVEC